MTEKSESYDPFEKGPISELIIEDMGLTDDPLMFRARCVGFTVESKAQAGSYQNVRGYWQFESEFELQIPINKPAQLVNDAAGNLDILAQAYRQIARALDLTVFQVAGERVDLQTVANDEKQAKKGGVKLGKKVETI